MKKLGGLLISLVFGLVLLVHSGFGQETAKATTGEEEFKANCASCHPMGGNVIKPDAAIKGSNKIKDFKKFLSWIRKPVQPMPAFAPTKISDAQAKKLYDYILTASKGEWK